MVYCHNRALYYQKTYVFSSVGILKVENVENANNEYGDKNWKILKPKR